jgi:valyl-tRNA synthetase
MICTFGDVTDVIWWRELDLPNRAILGWDGRILSEAPEVITDPKALEVFAELAGKTVFSARQRIVELLTESGDMVGEAKPITHPVKFFEKGDKPLEIVSTRQWYLRNGGRDEQLRDQLIALGKDLNFHPDFMRVRFENWVNGLTGDWLVSRQRFFGVPIPVWYALDAEGNPDYARVITPSESALPVDPSSQSPEGFTEDQRGKPNGFMGEVDILDTWATSSLTPQLAGGWISDPEKYAKVFPFSLRPQGQDIIRTWLFSTVLRSFQEENQLPWSDAALSGWILDPDRKKMSKSKGNVVVPNDLLDEHGSDAVRYWAAAARLGTDAAFDVGQMKVGRRLAIKVLNAAKFVLSFELASDKIEVTEAIDKAMLAALAEVVTGATKAFESFDHTKALELTESFFWNFTDDYLELVKERAYGQNTDPAAQASAVSALRIALLAITKLLAPFIPFATEEAWSWWQEGSVHRSNWPVADDLSGFIGSQNASLLSLASQALIGIRKAKSDEKLSMKAEINRLTIEAGEQEIESLKLIDSDLKSVGKIDEINYKVSESLAISGVSFKPAQ